MTNATIGGVQIVGESAAAWTLVDGVRCHTATFDVMPSDVKTLLGDKLKAVDLVIGSAKFSNLYVIQEVANEIPYLRRVLVADRRYFWPMRQIRRGFNMRRKTGVRRLSDPSTAAEAQTITPSVAYAPWSLKDIVNPWSAFQILTEVFKQIAAIEKDATGNEPKLQMSAIGVQLQKLPVENLFFQGVSLDIAWATILDYLPGVGCFVNAKGDVVLYSKTGGGEIGMVNGAGDAKVGGGTVRSIDLSLVRPSKIRVLFVREIEVRFDYIETDPGATSATSPTEPPRLLENVLPVPDFSLSVAGSTVCQGTWITVQQALTAWGPAPFVRGAKVLTMADLRRAGAPYSGLARALQLIGVADPNRDWRSRVAAMQQHYRRTYRIPKVWMDRIFRLRATRVATLDPTTAARGASTVYSDYSYLASERSVFASFQGGADGSYIINVPVFNGGNIANTILGAPATLSIVDEDQGIIAIDFLVDPARVFERVFPSCIELQGDNTQPGVRPNNCGPTGDLVVLGVRPNAWGVRDVSEKFSQLTANYKMAVILTAQPGLGGVADPSGGQTPLQFSSIDVQPKDVPSFSGQQSCKGPPLDILIGPGIETARIMWTDAAADAVAAAFNAKPVGSAAALDANTMNLDKNVSQDRPGGASCNAIAKAAAARVWAALADRMQGSMVGDLTPSLEPSGWLSSVKHSIETSGEMATALSLPDRVESMPLEAFLPASVTRIIHHLANPGG